MAVENITARFNLNIPEQKDLYDAVLELAEIKQYSRSQVMIMGLQVLFETYDPQSFPFADNDAGELARIREQQSSQQAIMAQFDILNDRLNVIMEKLDYLRANGFESTANEIMEDADIPDTFKSEMRQRFETRNT